MDKRAAAECLGVSVRTLERFAAKGLLVKGRAKGKTRPSVTFDESEVRELKEELDRNRPDRVFRRLNTEPVRDTVAFRLDPFYVKHLEEEGERLGMSAGEYARTLVIRSIESTDTLKARDETRKLRENLAEMFYLVLVQKMGAKEPEAERIVSSLLEDR